MLRGNPLRGTAETENKNKNEGREEVQTDLLLDLPGWLQEFRENLVDESVPAEPRETRLLGIETLPLLLMKLPMESRAKVEPGLG